VEAEYHFELQSEGQIWRHIWPLDTLTIAFAGLQASAAARWLADSRTGANDLTYQSVVLVCVQVRILDCELGCVLCIGCVQGFVLGNVFTRV